LYALTKPLIALVVAAVSRATVRVDVVVVNFCKLSVTPWITSETVLEVLLTCIPFTLNTAFCAVIDCARFCVPIACVPNWAALKPVWADNAAWLAAAVTESAAEPPMLRVMAEVPAVIVTTPVMALAAAVPLTAAPPVAAASAVLIAAAMAVPLVTALVPSVTAPMETAPALVFAISAPAASVPAVAPGAATAV
jgi:hypothetical protein